MKIIANGFQKENVFPDKWEKSQCCTDLQKKA